MNDSHGERFRSILQLPSLLELVHSISRSLTNSISHWLLHRSRFGLEIPRNKSRALIERHVRPSPLEENGDTIAKTDQENDVYEKPGQPREQSAEMDIVKVSDCLVSADRRHAAFVPVVKRLRLPAVDQSENVFRRVTTLLHRYRRNSRQRFAPLMREIGEVSNYLHFGMARYGQVFVHDDPARFIALDTERCAHRRRFIARSPYFHAAGNELVADLNPLLREVRGVNAGAQLDFQI